MQEYPSNILNVTNVIYLHAMYANIATGLKDLDTLEDAYKVMDQLNHFTQVNSISGKKTKQNSNRKNNKQASKQKY